MATAEQKEDPTKSGCPTPTKFKYPDKESELERWSSLRNILSRPSAKFAPDAFDCEEDNLSVLQEDFRVLVVGAGGLGCEILKNLALSGFKEIQVIDLDIIDLSNLNRQFLFRKKDIGKPKAKIAAEFVMNRVAGCTIQWYQKPLQEFPPSFYSNFDVVIAGLDNIEARRWLNSTLCDLVIQSVDDEGNINPDSIVPFIDGGTEGFKGQCRLFVPMLSSCFECSVETMVQPKVYMDCTIATIPRRPEHCIAFAKKKLFPQLKWLKSAEEYEMVPLPKIEANVFETEDDHKKQQVAVPNGVELDTDDVEHMSWIYQRSVERANEFGIEGVTYNLTMQVVKNIIPAIASTNALISALCVNEAFKALTWSAYGLNNYFMYIGQEGIYSRTWKYEKKLKCLVCSTLPIVYKVDPDIKFSAFYDKLLRETFDIFDGKTMSKMQLKAPSVFMDDAVLYYAKGKALHDAFKSNFDQKLCELMETDSILRVSDQKTLKKAQKKIKIIFEKGVVL